MPEEPFTIRRYVVNKTENGDNTSFSDAVIVEEPLEIQLAYSTSTGRLRKTVAITMRTPGNDQALATGFLFTEGILPITAVQNLIAKKTHDPNSILLEAPENFMPVLHSAERNFYSHSSCGICGKTSIESTRQLSPFESIKDELNINGQMLVNLPGLLREHQPAFQKTGGLHGCGIFDVKGNCVDAAEDVGRHNALDKLIGKNIYTLPLVNFILVLSGRVSFEMVQKAAMAGSRIIVAVGAPTSLAIDLATDNGITLIGFTNAGGFNIYTHARRVITHQKATA